MNHIRTFFRYLRTAPLFHRILYALLYGFTSLFLVSTLLTGWVSWADTAAYLTKTGWLISMALTLLNLLWHLISTPRPPTSMDKSEQS